MSKQVTILAMGLVALLAGCAQMAGSECNDTVTVDYKEAFLHARPPVASVCRGGTLTVVFHPIGNEKDKAVHTAPGPQNGNASWLSGRSTKGDQIVLHIDEKAQVGQIYKYSITVDGIGMLDPRVRVMK
jgi:hypothetical protein